MCPAYDKPACSVAVQQLLQAARVVVQEIAGDRVVLCVLVVDVADAFVMKTEDFRLRVGLQDGRMGGDAGLSIRKARMAERLDRRQVAVQRRDLLLLAVHIARAALGRHAQRHGDRLQHGRLAGPILADEEGDVRVRFENG